MQQQMQQQISQNPQCCGMGGYGSCRSYGAYQFQGQMQAQTMTHYHFGYYTRFDGLNGFGDFLIYILLLSLILTAIGFFISTIYQHYIHYHFHWTQMSHIGHKLMSMNKITLMNEQAQQIQQKQEDVPMTKLLSSLDRISDMLFDQKKERDEKKARKEKERMDNIPIICESQPISFELPKTNDDSLSNKKGWKNKNGRNYRKKKEKVNANTGNLESK